MIASGQASPMSTATATCAHTPRQPSSATHTVRWKNHLTGIVRVTPWGWSHSVRTMIGKVSGTVRTALAEKRSSVEG